MTDETKKYIGTKTVTASPMTRQAWCEYRGWQLPTDENGDDAGYLIEFVDGPPANDSRHAGYITWNPVSWFDLAYCPIGTFHDRVRAERADLHEKLTKLEAFAISKTFAELSLNEQILMRNQQDAMDRYLHVLDLRIAAFAS